MTAVPKNSRSLVLSKLVLQLGLGALQPVALGFRQRLAGAVDIKRQHRQRRAIGAGLAAPTTFRGALQRGRDSLWIPQREDAVLQIERIALARDALRPAIGSGLLVGGRFSPRRTRLAGVGFSSAVARDFARCRFARARGFSVCSHHLLPHRSIRKTAADPIGSVCRNAGTGAAQRR